MPELQAVGIRLPVDLLEALERWVKALNHDEGPRWTRQALVTAILRRAVAERAPGLP